MSATVVVIGAGPYGLSTAAHLNARGLRVRIFGSTMESWERHMPAGMLLKSPPAASTLSAPRPGHTLADFCREAGEPQRGEDEQVPIEVFVRYGRWYAEQLVPEVEDERVLAVDRRYGGFPITLSSGERLRAGAVVVASGLTGFAHLPPVLAQAAPGAPDASHARITHSSRRSDLSAFAGRQVIVVGAGQSALESAALLHEHGARVRLLVRGRGIGFGAPPTPPPHWRPDTPLGRSWGLYGVVNHAPAVHRLPAGLRLRLVREVLGPLGAWWLKERVQERIPVLARRRIVGAEAAGDGMALTTRHASGRVERLGADHVLAATGYRPRLEALGFLSPALLGALGRTGGFPRLDAEFASTVPGLYFTGLPAAAAYGPLMRFVCGTAFASPRVAAAVEEHLRRAPLSERDRLIGSERS
ncbi:NAD(P)-binding domain-containing protein [Streptomyces sp. ODS28]|uniref:NAD(P)-binding domain-containing protein n=1 Tax=Streptomyces sp. ODS28 TaxID=3136688 RepID=UPI0031EDA7DA